MLQDRIAAAEAAMGDQKSQQSISSDASGSSDGPMAGGLAVGGSSVASSTKQRGWYGRRKTSGSTGAGGKQTSGAPANSGFTAEPPQERPMSADEARGFGPDGNGGSDDQPYTPKSGDKVT
jgi:hypothetical protein